MPGHWRRPLPSRCHWPAAGAGVPRRRRRAHGRTRQNHERSSALVAAGWRLRVCPGCWTRGLRFDIHSRHQPGRTGVDNHGPTWQGESLCVPLLIQQRIFPGSSTAAQMRRTGLPSLQRHVTRIDRRRRISAQSAWWPPVEYGHDVVTSPGGVSRRSGSSPRPGIHVTVAWRRRCSARGRW